MGLFSKILDLTGSPNRSSQIPQIEQAYLEVITKYPLANLSHESYWRLVQLYLNDVAPPAFQKAEDLYARYRKTYPEVGDQNPVGDALADGYYRTGDWKKLLKFYTPVVRKFIQTGTLTRPHDLFMYTEAKYRLGDYTEAVKGYRIVISRFPKAQQSVTSLKRLDEIREKQGKKP